VFRHPPVLRAAVRAMTFGAASRNAGPETATGPPAPRRPLRPRHIVN
jgi:hypothetical protein